MGPMAQNIAYFSRFRKCGSFTYVRLGEMAEWSKAPVSKTGIPQGIEGSNPSLSAKIENRNRKQKCGRREAPSVLNSPQKILNLKGFATLRVAPRLPIQNYE